MPRPRPLFLMGNKRSGSTLTVNMLNSHPRVFVSHESDIAWILYQARKGMPARFEVHPLDSAMMMTSTLRSGRRILKRTLGRSPSHDDIVEAFYAVETRLMDQWLRHRSSLRGRAWRRLREIGRRPTLARIRHAMAMKPDPLHKEDLAWIGDKKHAQHMDPDIRAFLEEHFPDARYIHIVRNPKGVVASMVEASKTWFVLPEYFKGSAQQILEQWATHEELVQQAKERERARILTVRLEDLCKRPLETLSELFAFLELEMTDAIRARTKVLVHPFDPNAKYAEFPLPDLPRARRLMQLYGYA